MTTYSFLIGLGASLAILRVVQNVPRWQSPRWSNAALISLLGLLIGARLVYVIFQWSYFRSHLLEIFALWTGGLAWIGAIAGALISLWIISSRWKTSILKIADGLSPMAPPLVVSAWLGSWLAGFAYGPLAPEGAFWGIPGPDETGVALPRFPLQLIAAVSMLIFAFWLETRKTSYKWDGQKAALMLLGLAGDLLIFMPLRADPAPNWLGIRLDVWGALIVFLFSAGFYYWVNFRRTQLHESNPS